GPAGTDFSQPEAQAVIERSLERLKADPRVAGVVDYATTGDPRFVSTDRSAAYAAVELLATDEESVGELDGLRALIDPPPPGYTMQLTGYAQITKDSAHQSEADLQRAETVSLPLALLILVAVFGSLIAAGLPLLVAGLAIPSALALVYLVAQRIEMSVFVLNVSTMLGLALAIDYSLFIVSRFKEELARGRSVGEAVERSIGTSGKAVTFSGAAVAIGNSGLFFLKAPALASIGIGGSLVVLCSVFYALTFLPAVLGMLGPRVERLTLGGLVGRIRRTRPETGTVGPGRWERVALSVMRHPIAVLVPVLGLLFVAGSPFFRLEQGVPGASIYPAGLEGRDAWVALQREFPAGESTPITILVDVPGEATDPGTVKALAAYAGRIEQIPGIARVSSPFSHVTNPKTGADLTADQLATLYSAPAGQRPAGLDELLAAYVRGSTVRLDAFSPLDPAVPAATSLVPRIRSIEPMAGARAQVGGPAALGHDFLSALYERLPWAVATVLLAMAVILFFLFGSVVLPVKAVVMTLLSISGSFGALVWIFQDGNLSTFLDFDVLGYTIAGNPIIMFCVLFGLSMDYEVLLLSRIQEAYRRTDDNARAVAEGLSRTARVITGAALIMVSVFAAFALADTITIKSLGVGMAIAVLLDATIIRVLLVPATMRLLGRWNWWAPGVLGRLADRLGFSHVEDDDAAAMPSPAA
ncbi:MAG TPA: MMPL family transporter, partial [Candidatus Limnocylindrales bacterium]